MRHPARELSDRLHFLRLKKRFPGFFELASRSLLFGHVSRHLGIADEGSMVIEDAIDNHVSPETRAVLSYAPSFILHPADGAGDREVPIRNAAFAVLLRIEM